LFVQSSFDSYAEAGNLRIQRLPHLTPEPESSGTGHISTKPDNEPNKPSTSTAQYKYEVENPYLDRYPTRKDRTRWELVAAAIRHVDYNPVLEHEEPKIVSTMSGRYDSKEEHTSQSTSRFSKYDLRRRLASKGISTELVVWVGGLPEHNLKVAVSGSHLDTYYRLKDSLVHNAHNFPKLWLYSGSIYGFFGGLRFAPLLMFLYLFLPAVYGGVHLSAWTFEFPTWTERMLWRAACFDIMGTSFVAIILVWSYFGLMIFLRHTNPLLEYTPKVLLAILFLCYAISRVFIVVEAFVSLRHVPIGVYLAVPWTQSIPHI
jgi:hypothetical protein